MEFLDELKIVNSMGSEVTKKTAAEYCEEYDIAIATFNRALKNLRHLGAVIEINRTGRGQVYSVSNWKKIEKIVAIWIEQEEKRHLGFVQ